MESKTDRRQDPRWSPLVKSVTSSELINAEFIDLSPSGFRFSSKKTLPLGYIVGLNFQSMLGEDYKIEGRIVWKSLDKKDGNGPINFGALLMSRADAQKYRENFMKLVGRQIENRRTNDSILPSFQSATPSSSEFAENRGRGSLNMKMAKTGKALDRWISNHTYERVVEENLGPIIHLRGKPVIMLGSNSYLGMGQHPRVKMAAIKAIEKYGAGAGSVRALGGTLDIHKELEEKLAEFKGSEACLLLPSGFSANIAALTALLSKDDVVFNDEMNHASIVDGCRQSGAQLVFFKHSDMASLERKLQRYPIEKPKLIISDGVFSMDGDVGFLDVIIQLAKKYNAMTMVDDAHATGVVGATGHGSAEHCGVFGKIDITIATLSKGLGAIGGAVCGPRALMKKIFYQSRSFIFTSALPPSVCASVIAALEVINLEPELLSNLRRNRKFLYDGLKGLGYNVQETPSALIPVILGNENKTYELTDELEKNGVYVNAVARPAVPRKTSRLRVSVMATHTLDHLGTALEVFKRVGQRMGIVS
jgi:glycine C-acetyltransferase